MKQKKLKLGDTLGIKDKKIKNCGDKRRRKSFGLYFCFGKIGGCEKNHGNETIYQVIGIAVIGLTIFTATIEKSREFGVLKAIGFSGSQLFAVAFIQSLVAGLVGFLLAQVLTP